MTCAITNRHTQQLCAAMPEFFIKTYGVESWNKYRPVGVVELSCANFESLDLTGTNLNHAKLNGAKLNGAKLNGAELNGAELNGAKLNGAKLNGAKLNGAEIKSTLLNHTWLQDAIGIIRLPSADPRSYQPYAVKHGDDWIIFAGCRRFTIAEARKHWGESYKDREIAEMRQYAIDWLEKKIVSAQKEST